MPTFPACTFDTSACGGGTCGDGVINGPEQCDGATNQTCFSIGFDGGSVGCSDATCSFAVDNCSKFGWNPESLNEVEALAVGGFSPDDIWAVGSNGRATRYDGRRWLSSPTNVTNHLIAVWSIAANDAWAVGLGQSSAVPSLLLKFDGTSWNRVLSAPVADYVDVWAASSNAVFAATSANGIQAFDGMTWSQLGTFNRKAIAIRGSSINDIWVATESDALNGELMHWNGTGWSSATLTNAKIRFIDVNAPDDVWVAATTPRLV
ncbi:MAG: hypothetical protein H0T42_22250 [Deltaproteobacteria bacterium]|nr:hypothetical protein [Deltaproteobacteria bacterium]